MPDHPATDDRGQIDLVRETAAVLLIRQDIDRQRQPTSGQHGHQTGVTKRTDEAVERHGGEMVEHSAQPKLSPPCVASKASRATSGRIWR